ncbi:MAG: ribonuclease P protein component [Gammaproteobacteria bacterium RIFCSPHIGHO2_12_FULL_37_14]|nr:MAG: ribonuclease P protein component [Gammaproteobacteria bacterium RIFCSPHIGHO2_12_FULL_37_14]
MLNFPRTVRLTTKREFQQAFQQPCKVSNHYLLALFKPNQRSYPKLGMKIGKHLIKRAVDRNQLKRIIRESFRHHQEVLKGLDIVVLIRSKCRPLEKKIWRNDIDALWQVLLNSLKTV